MKKDLYGVAYVITSILILGAIFYYQFQVRKDTLDAFDQKDLLIQLSARQEMLSQQIAKSAVGMGYAIELGGERAEPNFLVFQRQLARILPEWEKVHIALKNGDDALGVVKPEDTNEYGTIRKDLDNCER